MLNTCCQDERVGYPSHSGTRPSENSIIVCHEGSPSALGLPEHPGPSSSLACERGRRSGDTERNGERNRNAQDGSCSLLSLRLLNGTSLGLKHTVELGGMYDLALSLDKFRKTSLVSDESCLLARGIVVCLISCSM